MNRLFDLHVNCAVRRVLVRHWIDLGKISIRTMSGVSYLSGALCRLPKVTPALSGHQVAEILAEIERVPAVRRVQPNFTNWWESVGGWEPIAPKDPTPVLKKALPDTPVTLDLTELERELESETERE
jgi:hypothetical protein